MRLSSAIEKQDWSVNSASPGYGKWQFALRHLFGLTTISAIAAALVAAYGPRTLLASGGLFIAWLNQCGAFESVQDGRRRRAVLWLAWGTFLVSLALPSLRVF